MLLPLTNAGLLWVFLLLKFMMTSHVGIAMNDLICVLYYKHITIITDNSSVVNKFEASLTDDARVIIYDCHMSTDH